MQTFGMHVALVPPLVNREAHFILVSTSWLEKNFALTLYMYTQLHAATGFEMRNVCV